jgi:hypothetical protein
MQENTPEFLEFVKQCQEKFLGISLPTIEILYSQKLIQAEATIKQDEKPNNKKSKK